MRCWVILCFAVFLALPQVAYSQCNIPEDYTLTRPEAAKGPTKIKAGLYLIDLQKINDMEGTFTADFFVLLTWKDPRLTAEARGGVRDECQAPLIQVWFPTFFIHNQVALTKEFGEWVQVKGDGTVTYAQRYLGSLSAPLYLKDFPFDQHVLEIDIVSGPGVKDVQFEVDEGTSRKDKLSIFNWSLGPGTAKTFAEYIKLSDEHHSHFRYDIEAIRERGYFFWKIIFPIFLIVLISWAAFWISPLHRVAQISLSSTAFLTLIAFQIRLSIELPPLPYQTRFGYFNLLSISLVFLALFESIATSILAGRGEETMAKRVDKWSRLGFPLVYIALSWITFFG